jgi:multicomponent Na+:H+ antiporter subunit G
VRTLAADALTLLGLAIMTVGVYGVARLPDVYTQLHAASKAALLGVALLLAAAALVGDGAVLARVVLIVALLVVTTPVAAHAVARAAHARGEEMDSPGALDESRLPGG